MNKKLISKKIAYISVVHPLHDHRFLYKQCKGLAENDFDVDYYVKADKDCVINNIKIIALKEYSSRLKRFFSSFGILPKLIKGKYDAIHLVDPELLPLGLILKIFTKKIIVFDAHEDYEDFMKHKHYLNSNMGKLFSLIVKKTLNTSSKLFDGFVFADEGTASLFSKLPQNRKCFFYNFPVNALFSEKMCEWDKRKYDICFLGTMSKTSGVFVIMNSLKIIKESIPNFKCLLIGQPGDEVDLEVKSLIKQYNLSDNIEITGKLPHGQVPELLQGCKIGLITLVDIPKFHKNIATKMFEYMASGIPVISSDLPPERKYIEAGKCGDFFPPEDHAALAQKILSILLNPEKGLEMSNYCLQYMNDEKYFAEFEMEKLSIYYKFLFENPRRLFCGN